MSGLTQRYRPWQRQRVSWSFGSSDRKFCSFAQDIQQYPHFSGFLTICYTYTSFGLVLTYVTIALDETRRVTWLKTWGGGTKSTSCVLGTLIYEGIKLGRIRQICLNAGFSFFLCLHHQNNRVGNVSISLFAPLQLRSQKTIHRYKKYWRGNCPLLAQTPPQKKKNLRLWVKGCNTSANWVANER